MKIFESREGERECKVLAAMIGSPAVLARVAPKWEEGMFSSPHCNLIASWCISFHQEHSTCPGKGVIHLFESWRDKNQDEETIKLVEKQLSAASAKWEEMEDGTTPEALVNIAGEHFNRVKLKRLSEAIQGDLDVGKLDKAEERINSHCKVELGAGSSVALLNDEEEIQSTFDHEFHESLVDYPGDLGKFFNRTLRRGGFIAFGGPEKSGKSYMLLDVAIRALEQHRKVAYFQVGDLTKTEFKERFLVRVARHPLTPSTVKWPTELILDDSHPKAIHRDREFTEALNAEISIKACKKMLSKKLKTKRVFFRLSCHGNMTIDVTGMRSILESWAREDWIPDVVICDYADVLAPRSGLKDKLEQINDSWARMRTLSQECNCLLVTATQVKRSAYGKAFLTRDETADDKRKLSHVTGMVGISCGDQDKENGVARLNWVVLREREFVSSRTVTVAQCLDLSQSCVLSMFNPKRKKKEVEE